MHFFLFCNWIFFFIYHTDILRLNKKGILKHSWLNFGLRGSWAGENIVIQPNMTVDVTTNITALSADFVQFLFYSIRCLSLIVQLQCYCVHLITACVHARHIRVLLGVALSWCLKIWLLRQEDGVMRITLQGGDHWYIHDVRVLDLVEFNDYSLIN